MSQVERPVPGIIEMGRWLGAVHRANETDRADALFRDPFARRLAGKRGEEVSAWLGKRIGNPWNFVVATYLFDQVISEQVDQGVDMVIDLEPGLGARPYRMALPATLQWIEVDHTEATAYKNAVLSSERPSCRLERIALELADVRGRRALFDTLGQRAQKALVMYNPVFMTAEEAGLLAEDLARPTSIRRWLMDVFSPAVLSLLRRAWRRLVGSDEGLLKFAPLEGPDFFVRYGWRPVDIRSVIKTAARLKRLSFLTRLLARLPEPYGPAISVSLMDKSHGLRSAQSH